MKSSIRKKHTSARLIWRVAYIGIFQRAVKRASIPVPIVAIVTSLKAKQNTIATVA
jgi:hypothetical protein